MEPESLEGWRIEEHADGKGYRATRFGDPCRSLSVRLESAVLQFEGEECIDAEFPRAVVERLFALLDSLIARRDQATVYEVERN